MLGHLSLQSNGVPIYVQLREQILALVGRGLLKPGAQIPTMRQVAVALKIDLNTVQRAYAELQRDGLLTLSRGRGTYVAEAPPPPRNLRAETQRFAAQVAAQAQAAGIALDDLAEALSRLKAWP